MNAVLWVAVLLAPSVVLLTCGARSAHNANRRDKPSNPSSRPNHRQEEIR